MKRILILLLALLVLAGCASTQTQTDLAPFENTLSENNYATQVTGDTSQGNAAIEATPRDTNPLTIELSLNTHSVDLSRINFTQQVTLIINNISYAPVGAAQISGHHASIPLTFDRAAPERFTLIIKDVGLEKERVYVWEDQ